MIDIYRITAVLKVETGTQRDIQNWHYCFIGNVIMCLTSDLTLTDNFQYHGNFVDTENIAGWDLRKNGRISDNGVY